MNESLITSLFSGFAGVCIGAWITDYLQEKSTIEKKKTELLTEILKKGYSGAELVHRIARATMIFQSQSIDSNLKRIFNVYCDKDTSRKKEKLEEDLKKGFTILAKSMRENLGINKDALTDNIIEDAIKNNSYSR